MSFLMHVVAHVPHYLVFYTTQKFIILTIHTSYTRLPFLDLWINIDNNRWSFNCFQKTRNTYEYIPYSSNHPLHVKNSYVSNELKRYMVKESTTLGYLNMKKKFFTRLRARGYPTHFILKNFRKHPYSLRYTRHTPTVIIKEMLSVGQNPKTSTPF